MLDTETKRRIDTARDILVGKVPDPKSQVEQITIALIYKFMDDMDAEAEELGGKRSFFVGEFEKFSWAKLLSPALGGAEMLNLYSEAIDRMTRNQNVPQLFRDIFKNAYLPYRDPETLKLFLKTINEFSYDHSERLGDAFEYLLSVLGSQGDAGQFRTPRHIIDFMVKVLDPQKTDTILDPACGTAGFLISAYKHILAENATPTRPAATLPQMGRSSVPFGGGPGRGLTPDERARLANNIRGYDISPDMVRLSLVNLYLHGFNTPNIFEYDTLTSEERWGEYADVILANPPFMSPKGGIKPHKHFSVQSNRSEVLFVDYMAEHLTPAGRAAIIVPEGIIFQSAGAYKQLRKYLIEQNYLWAVVSLPAGAFNPYSGVKTSILFLDRVLAKKTDQILFVKVAADGFDLGAQRRPVDKDDLPGALETLRAWQHVIASRELFAAKQSAIEGQPADKQEIASGSALATTSTVLAVAKTRLVENDYNLSADRYRDVIRAGKQSFPMVTLGDERYFGIESGGTPDSKNQDYWNGDVYWATLVDLPAGDHISIIIDTQRKITQKGLRNSSAKIVPPESIIVSSRATIGRVGINKIPLATNQGFKNIVIKDRNLVDPMFVAFMAKKLGPEMETLASGGTFKEISKTSFTTLQIPLPPLEIQRQIVDEIAAHQRIIKGAHQVVEGWRPNLDVELAETLPDGKDEWEREKLDNLCEIVRGSSPRPKHDKRFYGGNVPRLMVADITRDGMYVIPAIDTLTEEGAKQSRPMKKGDLVMVVSGQPGLCAILAIDACIHDGISGFRNLNQEKVLTEFAYYYMMSQREINNSQSVGAVFLNLNNDQLRQLKIPLPPLDKQREIVGRIERERAIVEGNRELIKLYEEKVKKVIERVWDG